MTLIQGNALDELKKLDSESIDCCITSPPYYALRDYKQNGMIWDADPNCKHDFNIIETKRPNSSGNKHGFGATRDRNFTDYNNRVTKSNFCSKCKAWKGQLGLEPTFQLYLNHLIQIFSQVKRVLKKSGTCWVVMGDSYNGTSKSLIMIPSRFAISMIDSGWVLRNDLIWWKPNCMPSSAKDRFTVDYEHIFFFTKDKKYYFKTQYEPHSRDWTDDIPHWKNGTAKHGVFYSKNAFINPPSELGRIKRTVWKIPPKPFPEAHFAVFPEELVRQCIDAGCPSEICIKCDKAVTIDREIVSYNTTEFINNYKYEGICNTGSNNIYSAVRAGGPRHAKWKQEHPDKIKEIRCNCNVGFKQGIVIDPFSGAGTTYKIALETNRKAIGIELNPEYIEITKKRIAPLLAQTKLTSLVN